MIRIYLILFIIFSGILYAEPDINSMLRQLKPKVGEDRILILNEISTYYYIKDDAEKFEKYAKEALTIAKGTNKQKEIDAVNQLAFVFSYRNKKMSSDYAKKALEMAKAENYKYGITEALFNIGYAETRKKHDSAVVYYIKVLNLTQNETNNFVAALANSYMGEIYSQISNYNDAIKYLISAQKIYDELLKSKSDLKTVYFYGEMLNSLGITYKKLSNFDEAAKYYSKYMKISKTLGNDIGVAIALNNLGVIYYKKKDYKGAISNFNEARLVFEKINIDYYSGTIYNNLGNIYADMKDYEKSEANYALARSLYLSKNDSSGQALVSTNLADLYFVRKNFRKAKSIYEESMRLIKGMDREILLTCYQGLAIVNDSLKMLAESYKYYKLFTQLKDTLSESSKAEEIGAVTENYKNARMIEEQKKHEAEEQQMEQDKQQRKYNLEYMGITIFLLFFFAFIIFFNKYKISTANLESIVFVALLFLFEFIMVFCDPVINRITGGEPIFNLLINALIALSLTPLDTYLEKIIRHGAENKEKKLLIEQSVN